ncbi:MAG: hypothetical protein QNJ54_36865 [Prochloraceae cyanobacterium]|nr:hypothetical protein [Prochloraceae cyanobacterium]
MLLLLFPVQKKVNIGDRDYFDSESVAQRSRSRSPIAIPTFSPTSTNHFHNFSWFFCKRAIALARSAIWWVVS